MVNRRTVYQIPKSLMVGVSGVRGIIGEGLRPEIITRFAAALGTYLGPGPVIIGKDTRPSGQMVENAVIAGLMSVGTNIINIGIAPTPTIQFAVKKQGLPGGIIISASHNPEQWNAIKFLGREGILLNQEQGIEVVEIAESQNVRHCDWNKLGTITQFDGALNEHIDAILKLQFIKLSQIRRKKFKVVIDCINGAGSIILPKLLKRLGCKVIPLNCSLSGIFPRNPEPSGNNLRTLCREVKKHKADIGFATDPDGDRLAVVDEKGKFWGEEYTLVACVDYFLRSKKSPVVINVSTTMAIEDTAEQYQCPVYRAKVGEINVIQKMIESGSEIGGEGNGGVIIPAHHYGRDSLAAIILILQSLTDQNLNASKLRASFPNYHIIKDKITVDGIYLSKITQNLEKSVKGHRIDKTDGLKIIGPDWWVHFRKSNTEPIIRLIIEAKTLKKIASLKAKYLHIIKKVKN